MTNTAIIHCTGLFPRSDGMAKTWCGKLVPRTSQHFDIISERRPNVARRCKVCDRMRKARNKRLGW